MDCEICGQKDPNPIVSLPLHQPNGSLITMACEPCAVTSSAYCGKHDKIHQGFADGTTACTVCVEELVAQEMNVRGGVRKIQLEHMLPSEEMEELNEWLTISSEVTKNSKVQCLIRVLASKALRLKISIDEVLLMVVAKKSANSLLT